MSYLSSRLPSGLRALALASFHRPYWVLALAGLMTALSVYAARDLTLDAKLSSMLPERFASVQALRELERRTGSESNVAVVLRGTSQKELQRFADRLAPQLEALAAVRYVTVQRPQQWYLDHGLFLLAPSQLAEATEQLEDRVARETQRRNPFYFDLEDEDDEPPTGGVELLAGEGVTRWAREQGAGTYFEDPEQGIVVLFARPSIGGSDLAAAGAMLTDIERVAQQEAAKTTGVQVALCGRYKKQADLQTQIQTDLRTSSVLALALMLGYLWLYFRRAVALLQLGVPLIMGVAWTFGVLGALFGSVNILTAFIGAILLGLGIDHGIHLLSSYEQARLSGKPPGEAIASAFEVTGRPVLVAALTTAVGFGALGISDFRTFREFGVAASLGMTAILLAYAFCLPAIVRLHSARRLRKRTLLPWLVQLRQHPIRWLGAAGTLTALCLLPLGSLRFNYDFAALQDARLPSFRLDKRVTALLGHSQSPTLVLVDSVGQAQDVARLLRENGAGSKTSSVGMVASPSDLLGGDEAERQALIERIVAALGKVRRSWLEKREDQESYDQLRRMTEQSAPSRETLPTSVRQQFGLADREGAAEEPFVLVYPADDLTRRASILSFAAALQAAAPDSPLAGESIVLADILDTVQREGPWVLAASALGTLLALWVLQGRLLCAGIALGVACLSLAAGLGLLSMLDIRLNYLNMIVIPVLFGVTVDGSVHLLDHWHLPASVVSDSLRGISAATVTTALGFSTLLIADHPGLQSVGQLALVGLAASGLVSLVLLPAVLSLLGKSQNPRAPHAKQLRAARTDPHP